LELIMFSCSFEVSKTLFPWVAAPHLFLSTFNDYG
jgi:hypothetical protein